MDKIKFEDRLARLRKRTVALLRNADAALRGRDDTLKYLATRLCDPAVELVVTPGTVRMQLALLGVLTAAQELLQEEFRPAPGISARVSEHLTSRVALHSDYAPMPPLSGLPHDFLDDVRRAGQGARHELDRLRYETVGVDDVKAALRGNWSSAEIRFEIQAVIAEFAELHHASKQDDPVVLLGAIQGRVAALESA